MNQLASLVFIVFLGGYSVFGQQNTDCILMTDSIFDIEYTILPDVVPEYPGGIKEMNSFLLSNIEYPETGMCGMGMIYISFFVLKDGTITHIKVEKSFDDAIAQEGVKAIKKMPKWSPGKCNGNAVNVKYTIPINIHFR
ncbi:energy transducer TonB [Paracrocinitomix mangrovi]|uniref:energy transducer TonB n=1 Tax=Paracrocinitomix mangrovi TaxID=2862509 RepID=UPI001C8E1EEE|nr:energy transducer TonB [Paracrocinitomix mangrovi]UKN03479.1 energy transducer TonB [Paracrocinitomix mangrovi]